MKTKEYYYNKRVKILEDRIKQILQYLSIASAICVCIINAALGIQQSIFINFFYSFGVSYLFLNSIEGISYYYYSYKHTKAIEHENSFNQNLTNQKES